MAKENEDKGAAVAELVRIASDAGFDFTAADYAAVREAAAGELSEEELEKVAGGGVGCPTVVSFSVTCVGIQPYLP